MSSGFRRDVIGALAAFSVLVAGADVALAQSDRTSITTPAIAASVNFTPEALSAFGETERALTAAFVAVRNNDDVQGVQQAPRGPSGEDEGIGIGVLGMITRTSYKADSVQEFFDAKSGYGFGLWVGGNRNGRVGFTGEFIYLIRGSDDSLKTRALQIPAVFHINVGSRSRNSVGGYIVVGPSFTINLKQELNGVPLDNNFNGANIGIIGGAGVEFFRIGLEGRGNWELRSIDSDGTFGNTKAFTFEFLAKFAFN